METAPKEKGKNKYKLVKFWVVDDWQKQKNSFK